MRTFAAVFAVLLGIPIAFAGSDQTTPQDPAAAFARAQGKTAPRSARQPVAPKAKARATLPAAKPEPQPQPKPEPKRAGPANARPKSAKPAQETARPAPEKPDPRKRATPMP
jgi:outer membrane biosynthesis protein TonB